MDMSMRMLKLPKEGPASLMDVKDLLKLESIILSKDDFDKLNSHYADTIVKSLMLNRFPFVDREPEQLFIAGHPEVRNQIKGITDKWHVTVICGTKGIGKSTLCVVAGWTRAVAKHFDEPKKKILYVKIPMSELRRGEEDAWAVLKEHVRTDTGVAWDDIVQQFTQVDPNRIVVIIDEIQELQPAYVEDLVTARRFWNSLASKFDNFIAQGNSVVFAGSGLVLGASTAAVATHTKIVPIFLRGLPHSAVKEALSRRRGPQGYDMSLLDFFLLEENFCLIRHAILSVAKNLHLPEFWASPLSLAERQVLNGREGEAGCSIEDEKIDDDEIVGNEAKFPEDHVVDLVENLSQGNPRKMNEVVVELVEGVCSHEEFSPARIHKVATKLVQMDEVSRGYSEEIVRRCRHVLDVIFWCKRPVIELLLKTEEGVVMDEDELVYVLGLLGIELHYGKMRILLLSSTVWWSSLASELKLEGFVSYLEVHTHVEYFINKNTIFVPSIKYPMDGWVQTLQRVWDNGVNPFEATAITQFMAICVLVAKEKLKNIWEGCPWLAECGYCDGHKVPVFKNVSFVFGVKVSGDPKKQPTSERPLELVVEETIMNQMFYRHRVEKTKSWPDSPVYNVIHPTHFKKEFLNLAKEARDTKTALVYLFAPQSKSPDFLLFIPYEQNKEDKVDCFAVQAKSAKTVETEKELNKFTDCIDLKDIPDLQAILLFRTTKQADMYNEAEVKRQEAASKKVQLTSSVTPPSLKFRVVHENWVCDRVPGK